MSQRESTPWRRHLNRLATTLADVLFPVPPIPPYCYGGFGDVDIDQAEQLADYEADRDHLDPHALVCFRCGLDPITCTHELPATPPAGIAGPATPLAGPATPCTHCHQQVGVIDRDYLDPGSQWLCDICAELLGPLEASVVITEAAVALTYLWHAHGVIPNHGAHLLDDLHTIAAELAAAEVSAHGDVGGLAGPGGMVPGPAVSCTGRGYHVTTGGSNACDICGLVGPDDLIHITK